MTREPLDVWLYGTRLARLEQDARERISLTWTGDAEQRWGRGVRVLSHKLDVGAKPVSSLVSAYVDGLLPEGNARVNYALSAGLTVDDTYGLIQAYGRDTPGAAIFVPAGSPDPTRSGRYEPLTDAEVAERLRKADRHQPASPAETTESSTLPGMVPKIALHREAGRWFACLDGAPSTWILKRSAPADTEAADVVDTEVASLAIARSVGSTTIEAEILDFGDVRAIAVSRYDRTTDNGRLHQEDLAQALGLNTSDPNRKFQWGSEMPSLQLAADVLRLDGGDVRALLSQVTLSFLLGNTDMHAKNVSFLRHEDGRVSLTPAYDVAMHLHHQREERRFALDVNKKTRVNDVTVADLVAEGVRWTMPDRLARRVVSDTVEQVASVLGTLDRAAHSGVPEAAWACVEGRVRDAVDAMSTSSSVAVTRSGPRETVADRPRRGPRRLR